MSEKGKGKNISFIVVAIILAFGIYIVYDIVRTSKLKEEIATKKGNLEEMQRKREEIVEKRYAEAVRVYEEVKKENGGKILPWQYTRPEIALPPVLALVGDGTLGNLFGIDRHEIVKDIKQNPEKYKSVVPGLSRKRFLLLSEENEKILGDEVTRELEHSEKFCKKTNTVERVKKIAEKITGALPRKISGQVFVIEKSEVNAFCIPNGNIYVFTGLLDIVNDDELAFVIAHEYAHLVARHINENITKFLMTEGAKAFAEYKTYKSGKLKKLSSKMIFRICCSIGFDLIFNLPYSRQMEKEADILGLHYMIQAGYNPEGAISFFKTMNQNQEQKTPEWVKYISTHPLDTQRMEYLQKELDKMNSKK